LFFLAETRKASETETAPASSSSKKKISKSDHSSVGKTRGMSPGFNVFKEERKSSKGKGEPRPRVDDLKLEWENMSMEEKQVIDAALSFSTVFLLFFYFFCSCYLCYFLIRLEI
jgi:hypothetical protein